MRPKETRRVWYIHTLILVCSVALASVSHAAEWTTYQHDNSRSGITSEEVVLPLDEHWRYTSAHAPQQAWPAPAKQDFWHHLHDIKAKARYDETFHVAVSEGALYFGSSADDKLYCLDASTGKERWSFFAGGPVRFAPSLWQGNIYFGSDDGYVYCLSAEDGELVWRYRVATSERMIPGNGRMISAWPVRTNVLVSNGIAYACAGLFPKEKTYLVALDTQKGTEIWQQTPAISPQGYLLASEQHLYVPTGRTAPAVFRRVDGEQLGYINWARAEGGTYALLTRDSLVSGTGKKLMESDTSTRDHIATFAGDRVIVTAGMSYLLSENELSAIDRNMYRTAGERRTAIADERKRLTGQVSELREKRDALKGKALEALDKQINDSMEKVSSLDGQMQELKGIEYRWRRALAQPYHAMILLRGALVVGGSNEVLVLDVTDGQRVWSGETVGKASGLAFADGRLFVSTDQGIIHCFSTDPTGPRRDIVPSQKPMLRSQSKSREAHASVAERIVNETGIQQGYCVILGCGDGQLVYEIARRTDLRVIGVEEDSEKVHAARLALDRTGLYGAQVVVHQADLDRLPYTDYCANLVISQDPSASLDEMHRILQPYGGVAYLKQQDGTWKTVHRGPLEGAGEWTHQYANASNTACSGDRLVQGPMQVQWFGEPGPRPMIDRHHRALAPLFKGGLLFVPAAGENRVMAVDAYNGTVRWDVEVPHYRRVGANRDCGNMAVTDDYLYVATEDSCWGLDVTTGEHSLTFRLPNFSSEQQSWGFVASTGNLLFGSGQRKDATISEHHISSIYEIYFDHKPVATSDYLFCLDRYSAEEQWRYRDGTIINSAIAVGDRHLYFVESRNPELGESGRSNLTALLASGYGYLVALDKRTGNKTWERQADFPFEHVTHLSYANNTVVVLGTSNDSGHPRYDLRAFDATDGSNKWSTHQLMEQWGVNGDHGEQDQHAVIVGNNIYLIESNSYDLQTGTRNPYELHRGGGGCGTLSGSMSYLFARGGNPRMYEIAHEGEESGTALTHISRPGCWINIIPAGGLVLIPEFSSGCTCPYPIQTSMALVPYSPAENMP